MGEMWGGCIRIGKEGLGEYEKMTGWKRRRVGIG